ncbi:MAG: FAD-dependent oxidoreductase [Rubrivivax sp.]
MSPKFPNISIPYGALVPERLGRLVACGRHLSCDRNSHGFMREIPQGWITGQAAGVAAAHAVAQGVQPRAVDVRGLQAALLRQGVYLRPASDAPAATAAASSSQAAAANAAAGIRAPAAAD